MIDDDGCTVLMMDAAEFYLYSSVVIQMLCTWKLVWSACYSTVLLTTSLRV